MITIYHNPDCGTSRNTLEMLSQSGENFEVVEYLSAGWTRPQLEKLFKDAGTTPRKALRISKSPAEELGLTDETVSDDALIDAMIEHPILVNRPFVVTPEGTRLCRPSEVLFELLPECTIDHFTKEDGQTIER